MAVSTDWRRAGLAAADHAMLEFTEKLTLLPSGMTESDVAGLRRHGFSDREILSITLAAGYRNFITRVADALGVELRSSLDYAPEILHAFGVKETEVGATIYADRLASGKDAGTSSLRPRVSASPGIGVRKVCWIDTTPADAGRFPRVSDELARLTAPRSCRHLALAFARRSDALEATIAFGRLTGMSGSNLGRRLEAIIGVVVAATLWVPYLGVHHAQALLDAGASGGEVEKLIDKPAEGALVGREREVACFVEKMTRLPSQMSRADVEALRAQGFDDRDIVTIVASCAYESFLCGIAAGLGVQLEDAAFAPTALRTFEVTAVA